MHTLNQLRPGDRGVVQGLLGDSSLHQRLQEMGVIEGAEVEVVRIAPLGDPIEIIVQGYHLSLRKAEAAFVEVEQGC
ncbi:MAG: ferrous iron transport protein A [Candidatus Hydrogenedentes bacterium]|nr:ferrous iron transport protein A [Candidatus Hydrogenedentota bacterium]